MKLLKTQSPVDNCIKGELTQIRKGAPADADWVVGWWAAKTRDLESAVPVMKDQMMRNLVMQNVDVASERGWPGRNSSF